MAAPRPPRASRVPTLVGALVKVATLTDVLSTTREIEGEEGSQISCDAYSRARDGARRARSLAGDEHRRLTKRRFTAVLNLGAHAVIVGCVLYALSIAAGELGRNPYLLKCPAWFSVAVGVIVMSTCPPENETGFDTHLLSRGRRMRIGIGFGLLVVSAGSLLSKPPFLHSVPLIVSLWVLFGHELIERCGGDANTQPYPTTLVSIYLITDLVADGIHDLYIAAQFSRYARSSELEDTYHSELFVATGLIQSVLATLLSAWLGWQKYQFMQTDGAKGASPTRSMFLCLYAYLLTCATESSVGAVLLMTEGDVFDGPWKFALGLVKGFPVLIVAVVGRDALFKSVAYQFDHQHTRNDGSTVLSRLLSRPPIVKGRMLWGIQRGTKGSSKQTLLRQEGELGDARWERGIVTGSEIRSELVVRVLQRDNPNGEEIELPVGATLTTETLLDKSLAGLRCVDWEKMTTELLTCDSANHGSEQMQSLSRPVEDDDIIDFFVSHNPADDAALKKRKLEMFAMLFRGSHGRYPTFWCEAACLGRDQVGGGAKVLPVHISACNKMLVLAGPAYAKSLRCAFELYTIYSLVNHSWEATDRIEVVELLPSVLQQVAVAFHLDDTQCDDPNEDHELRAAISQAGAKGFVSHIRREAAWCRSTAAGNAMSRFRNAREQAKRKAYKKVFTIGGVSACIGTSSYMLVIVVPEIRILSYTLIALVRFIQEHCLFP